MPLEGAGLTYAGASEAIEKQAEEADARLRRQLSEAEREAEAEKARLREAERLERRKLVLPITKPRVLETKRAIERVEEQKQEFATQIATARAEVKEAKAKAKEELAEQKRESEAAIAQARADAEKAQADAEAKMAETHTRLDTGEWVETEWYNSLDERDQKLLNVGGVDAYNKFMRERFERRNVQLSTGEWVNKRDFRKLSEEDQKLLMEVGIEAYNETKQDEADKIFESENTEIAEGVWVSRKDFEALPLEEQERLRELGIEGYNQYLEDTYITLDTGETIERAFYDSLPASEQAILNEKGVDAYNKHKQKEANTEAREEMAKDNVELDTGEWIDKEFFYSLGYEEKVYLRKHGYDAFLKKYYKKLRSGEYVLLAAYNALPEKDRNQLYRLGVAGYEKWAKDYYFICDNGDRVDPYEVDKLSKEDQKLLKKKGIRWFNTFKQAELETHNVEITKGVWIPKAQHAGLTQTDIAFITTHGIDAFNEQQEEKAKEQQAAVAEFEATHKVIGDQAMANEDWEALDAHYRVTAIAYGFDAMQAEMERDRKAFEDRHIQLATGDWMPKEGYWGYNDKGNWVEYAGYNTLTKEQQDYINKNGIDAFNKKYGGVATETFEKAEARFLSLNKDQQRIALGMCGYSLITYQELTEAQKKDFIKKFIVKVPVEVYDGQKWDMKYIEKLNWDFQMQHYAIPVLAMTPVISTIIFWDDMSTPWKIASIILDVLILAPIAKAGLSAIKLKVSPLKTTSKAFISAELRASRQTISQIEKTFGKVAATEAKAVLKAQAQYIEQLVKIEIMEAKAIRVAKIAAKPLTVKEIAARAIKARVAVKEAPVTALQQARTQAVKLARALEVKAAQYVKTLKGKAGFDSPAIAKILADLPADIVRNSKAVIEALKSTVSVKALRAAVARAEAALKAVQAKFPLKPEMWIDKIEDVAMAQAKLEQALLGDVYTIYQSLLKARGVLASAKTSSAIAKASAEVARLEKALAKAVKIMEVEWGKGGFMTLGGGRDITKTAGTFGGGGTRVAIAEIKELEPAIATSLVDVKGAKLTGVQLPSVAPLLALVHAIGAKAKVPPAISPAIAKGVVPTTVSQTEVALQAKAIIASITNIATRVAVAALAQNLTKAQVKTATRQAVETAVKTIVNTQVKAQVKVQTASITKAAIKAATVLATATAVKAATKAAVKVAAKPLTKAQIKTLAETRTRLALKTAAKVKAVPKVKVKIVSKIIIPKEKRALTEKELAGSVAWKQGFIYILIYPPYLPQNKLYSKKPFPGVRVVKGAKSAYESIVRLGEKIPSRLAYDLGIMDIEIITPKAGRGKPRLKFRRDIRQRTKLTGISVAR